MAASDNRQLATGFAIACTIHHIETRCAVSYLILTDLVEIDFGGLGLGRRRLLSGKDASRLMWWLWLSVIVIRWRRWDGMK